MNAHPDVRFNEFISKKSERSVALLASLVATPSANLNPSELAEVAKLFQQPDKLAPYAHRMVESIVTGLDTDDRWGTAIVLMNLVAVLPDKEFSTEGPRLLPVLGRRSPSKYKTVSGTLLLRFGDLGPDALPFLSVVALSSEDAMWNWDQVSAMFGLCRLGKPASKFANEIRAKLLAPDPHYVKPIVLGAIGEASFITLLRLGRSDLTQVSGPEWEDKFVKRRIDKWRSSINEYSDPNVCKP